MRILVLAPAFPPAVDAGGPVRSLANLIAKHRSDHEFVVVCPDRDAFSDRPFPGLSGRSVTRPDLTIYYVDFGSIRQRVSIWRLLARESFDLVLLNSLWDRNLSIMPCLLRNLGILRGSFWVLAPRGELDPGALKLKAMKKRMFGPIVRRNAVRAVDVGSATSSVERQQIGRLLKGLDVVSATNVPDVLAPRYVAATDGSLRAVFVGRINRKKGLDRALQSMATCSTRVSFDIYGPLEDAAYWEECQTLIADLPDNVSASYRGVLSRDQVESGFAASDVFLFPTAGENFGHVIAESLQVGCPVIVPDVTPWSRFVERIPDALLSQEYTIDQLTRVLDRWGSCSPAELRHRRIMAREVFDQWADERGPDMIESLGFGDGL